MSKGFEEDVLKFLKDYTQTARRVKEIVKEIDPKVRVYVFGSVVKGRYTASSDIDILVVTERIEKKYDMMVKVYKTIKGPVELHVTTPEMFESWYMRFIEPDEIIEVQ